MLLKIPTQNTKGIGTPYLGTEFQCLGTCTSLRRSRSDRQILNIAGAFNHGTPVFAMHSIA
jgi:hypothetical protein